MPLPTNTDTPLKFVEPGVPIINIAEASREGITKVIFTLDPKIVDWIANSFYDSHLEMSGDKPLAIIPNVSAYQCPMCKQIIDRENAPGNTYLVCNGTKETPHTQAQTIPLNWHRILNQAGLYYLLGQVNAALNTNISTANFGTTTQDAKSNATLDDRLKDNAFGLSLSMLSTIIENAEMYITPDARTKLNIIFSASFDLNFFLNMTNNILANFTKGKRMEMLNNVLENRIRTETEAHHYLDQSSQFQTQENKSLKNRLEEMISF